MRSGLEHFRQAHIPGSHFADLLTEFSDPDAPYHFTRPKPAQLAAALQRHGIDRSRTVIVYDAAMGWWAARLWWVLQAAQVRAQVLNGGLAAWQSAGFPVAAGDPPARASETLLDIEDDTKHWIDTPTVERISKGLDPGTLVCALSEDAFQGSVPTRYRRRGHIPGSLNLPARALLDSCGRLRDQAALAATLAPLRAAARPLILYCGGGISAATTALALTALGEPDVRLYDGSLEAWADREDLPLVLGP